MYGLYALNYDFCSTSPLGSGGSEGSRGGAIRDWGDRRWEVSSKA